MSLSSVESRLPPGFRFHPKDEELICDYLVKWVAGFPHPFPSLINVDLNKCEPWDIPEIACVGSKEWYFYSQRDRKYATGLRTNRATLSGYWKATGKDRPISRKGTLMGMRKTLVFYQGRAPKGHKTDWVMHEFRLHEPDPAASHQPVKEEDWVLCRVFFKNRREIPSKQGASATSPAPGTPPYLSQLLPGLMDQACMAPATSDEQVSCFSIFNQTNPNLLDPPLSQMLLHPGPSKIFSSPNPSSSGTNFADLGIHSYIINPMMMHDIGAASNSSCNNNSSNNNNAIMKGSPVSFGEAGSSDSYLSEVGLSSLWINPYRS